MFRAAAVVFALGLIGALAGCAASENKDSANASAAYKDQPGPLPVKTRHRLELPFPALDKTLQMRMAWPDAAGKYPVIVLSHGNGCRQDLYAGFADHWASWGYVVIQPVHMDSRDLGFSMKGTTAAIMEQVISSRREDVSFILDSLAEIQRLEPDLSGHVDDSRLIAAGHSMGAGTVMSLTGVELVDPRDQSLLKSDEDRFDAVIVISEPGNNRLMPDAPWRMTSVPTIVATGTNDFSTVGARDGKKSKSAWQLPANAVFPDEPRYYLFLDGSDHYLGGVICRDDAPGPRDEDGLRIMNGATTAFMDAYIKGDVAAQQFLDSGLVTGLSSGRATLELRP